MNTDLQFHPPTRPFGGEEVAEGYGALKKAGGGGHMETMAAGVIAKSHDLGKVSDRYFTSAKNRFAFSGMPGS